MIKALFSEILKLKKVRINKLLWIIPLLTGLIAFLVGGVIIFSPFAIYWWESVFLYLLIGLLFLMDFNMEKKAGNFQNVKSNLWSFQIYLAKIFLIFVRVAISSLFFIILVIVLNKFFSGYTELLLSKSILSIFLLLLSVFWNIPWLYFLANFINGYLLIAVNTLVCLLFGSIISQTQWWFAFPYSYHYKISQYLLGVQPSGIFKIINLQLFDVMSPVLLSLLISLLLIYFTRWGKSND